MPEWDRQPGETVRSFAWFCRYRDMGAARSLVRIRTGSGPGPVPPLSSLKKWSGVHRWGERVAAFDDHLADEGVIAAEEGAREVAVTSAQLASRVRAEAMRVLDSSPSARDLLALGQLIVGLAQGLPEPLPALPAGPTPPGGVSRWTGRTIPASGSPEEAERVVGVLAILEEAGYLEISEPNTEPGSRFMRDLDGLPAGDVTTNGGPPADDIDIVDDEEGFGSWQSG